MTSSLVHTLCTEDLSDLVSSATHPKEPSLEIPFILKWIYLCCNHTARPRSPTNKRGHTLSTHFVIQRANHPLGISNSDEEHSVMQRVGGIFWGTTARLAARECCRRTSLVERGSTPPESDL